MSYRRPLTAMCAATGLLAAGTFAFVNAQDPADDHDHDHDTALTVHAGDGSHFQLDDDAAYPDGDGFATMNDRVCYGIGRLDGQVMPNQPFEVDLEAYERGVQSGSVETSDDRSQGYAFGRRIHESGEDINVDEFIAGIQAGVAEENDSVAMGYIIGNGYRQRELEIVIEQYMTGVRQGMALAEAEAGGDDVPSPAVALTDEQIRETLNAFGQYLAEKAQREFEEECQAFYDATAAAEGWNKTESGLLYRVIEEGEGDNPQPRDNVQAHYTGTLVDGTQFDSSIGGAPLGFGLYHGPPRGVIEGWVEGILLMKKGAQYELVIPAELAYGERGYPVDPRSGGVGIPPNALLRFTVELVDFESAPEAPGLPELPSP